MQILLIEDDPDHQVLFRRTIQMGDMKWTRRLEIASSATEGKAILETMTPDVIVLDLDLPDSPIVETIGGTIGEFSNFPIVVLTSLEDVKLGEDSIQAGAEDYLSKGQLTPALLRQTLRFARERHQNRIQLKRRNQELQDFAHTLAHELRNPLQTVSIAIEHTQSKQDLAEEEQQLLELANDSAQRMSCIIQNFLDYAESGDVGISEAVNLPEAVRNLVQKIEINTGISVELEIDAGMPPLMVPDTLFLQVVDNLLRNSVRYRHPERPVKVEIIREDAPKGFVTLHVKDNGQGISLADQERIFQPFFRGDAAASVSEGFGIGLSFCQRVIEAMGGTIAVSSEPQQGATFSLTIPLEEVTTANEKSEEAKDSADLVTG